MRPFTGSAWEACLAANEMSIRLCTSFLFFAFGIEFSNSHEKKEKKIYPEPITAMIAGALVCLQWRFLDFWLYFYIYF